MQGMYPSSVSHKIKMNKTEGGEQYKVRYDGSCDVDNCKELYGKDLNRSSEFRMLINLLQKQK